MLSGSVWTPGDRWGYHRQKELLKIVDKKRVESEDEMGKRNAIGMNLWEAYGKMKEKESLICEKNAIWKKTLLVVEPSRQSDWKKNEGNSLGKNAWRRRERRKTERRLIEFKKNMRVENELY